MDKVSFHLPTAKAIHDDTGLPFSSILQIYMFQNIRTLKKHFEELPFPIKEENDIEKTVNVYEKEIIKYEARFPNKGSEVRRKWEAVKAQYIAALKAELCDTQEAYEYSVKLPWKFRKYREENREKLLFKLKSMFSALTPGQKLKIAHYFNGYAGLFDRCCWNCDLLLGCISVMTETAKVELKQYIESKKVELDRAAIYWLSENIAWCQKIRISDNGKELHKNHKDAWRVLEKKFNELDIYGDDGNYEKMLGVALIIDLLSEQSIEEGDLEIIMSHALFLNRPQAADVLRKALDMLIPENIEPRIAEKQVQNIRKDLENEEGVNFDDAAIQGRLEQQFDLKLGEKLFN